MSLEKAKRGLEKYLKQKFPKCRFKVVFSDRSDNVIFATLLSGDFEAFDEEAKAWISKGGREGIQVRTSYKSRVSFSSHSKAPLNLDEVHATFGAGSLSLPAQRVFIEIFKYLKSIHGNDDVFEDIAVYYNFYIDNDYINKAIGTIAKPTKIEHKTFKGRKRRGVVEAVFAESANDHVVYAKNVKKSIEVYTKKTFPDCKFFIIATGYSVTLLLESGNFEAFEGRRRTTSRGDVQVRMSYGNKAKNLDPKDLDTDPNSGLRLSSDARVVFEKIVNYIKDNFKDNTETVYAFYIAGDYVNKAVGNISKPTEIEHKTFKGRKRRGGVVEKASIVDRVIAEGRPSFCRNLNEQNGTCRTGCYDEKVLRDTECPYDIGERKHCRCYK